MATRQEGQIKTVTLSLFRFDAPLARLWVLGQMALARISLARMPDAGFWKLCGSGTGEGFTPRPNWGVWAILVVWPDEATARRHVTGAALYQRWRRRADESWTVFLSPQSSRGSWAGRAPFQPTVQLRPSVLPVHTGHPPSASSANLPASPANLVASGQDEPGPGRSPGTARRGIAVLTRASLRPTRALRFWQRVPDISADIGSNPDVAFKIGIGELPLLHQVTFSIWPDTGCMARFAHAEGPHGRAIRAVRDGNWFREELYARFTVLGSCGHWGGGDPLERLARAMPPQPLPQTLPISAGLAASLRPDPLSIASQPKDVA